MIDKGCMKDKNTFEEYGKGKVIKVKITILDTTPGEEEEIIIKCNQLDDRLMQLVNQFKRGSDKLNVYQEGNIHLVEPQEIYYFETVDQKVFVYCKNEVYEIRSRIYELEEMLAGKDFFRASKSVLLNLNVIKSLSPAFNGRFEAVLKNGEHVIISRQYVSLLKEKLGL